MDGLLHLEHVTYDVAAVIQDLLIFYVITETFKSVSNHMICAIFTAEHKTEMETVPSQNTCHLPHTLTV